jgi:anaerobic dimethyl sulfoxide reductase subunit C (anchor subunit)
MPGPSEREWPLIGFTLLSQTAVGAFWTVAAAFLMTDRRQGLLENRVFTIPFLAAVLALLGLAAAVSLAHLGRPGRAPSALFNLKRSWLSREILFELAFSALVLVLAVLRYQGRETTPIFRALVFAAGAAGLLFLHSMSRLYRLRTVPAWRGFHTPLSFFASALLLGPLGVLTVRDFLFDFPGSLHAFQRAAVLVSLAAVLLILLTVLFFTPRAGVFGAKTETLRDLPASGIYPLLTFRLLYLGAALPFIFLFERSQNSGYILLAFVCAGVSEVLGRYLFYALYGRVGV